MDGDGRLDTADEDVDGDDRLDTTDEDVDGDGNLDTVDEDLDDGRLDDGTKTLTVMVSILAHDHDDVDAEDADPAILNVLVTDLEINLTVLLRTMM